MTAGIHPEVDRGEHFLQGGRDTSEEVALDFQSLHCEPSRYEVIRPSDAAQAIVGWLSGCEPAAEDEVGLLEGLGERLRTAGVPIDRLTLHIRIPHPELAGYTVAWAPGEPVEVRERALDFPMSPDYLGSPLRLVMETRRSMRVRLDSKEGRLWTHIDVFQKRELVEHFIVSLCSREGPCAVAFCTADPGGFSDTDWTVLAGIVPALRNAFELRILRRVERLLLDIYTGPNTAQRILAGQVQRGRVESMEVALMLCDLRGFTELSNRLATSRVLELLDIYFDRVVPTIGAAGGEVLKFMGDGVLAYFRRNQANDAAAAALHAATKIVDALASIELPDATLVAGIALHYGEVSYGNIGASHRLDFTVVGRDVNLVSRIEGVCATASQPILLSKRFSELVPHVKTKSIGQHALKGFSEPVELYSLQTGLHDIDRAAEATSR